LAIFIELPVKYFIDTQVLSAILRPSKNNVLSNIR